MHFVNFFFLFGNTFYFYFLEKKYILRPVAKKEEMPYWIRAASYVLL